MLCGALPGTYLQSRKSQSNQGILQEPHSLIIWFAKGFAGLRVSALQRARDSYTLAQPGTGNPNGQEGWSWGATPLPGCRTLEDGDCWVAGGLGLPASCKRRSLAQAAREGAGERSTRAGRPRSSSRTPDYFPLNNNNNNNCSLLSASLPSLASGDPGFKQLSLWTVNTAQLPQLSLCIKVPGARGNLNI